MRAALGVIIDLGISTGIISVGDNRIIAVFIVTDRFDIIRIEISK